jgi:hypothetical protein
MLQLQPKGSKLVELPVFWEGQDLFLLKPSTAWKKPTHFMADNLLYSQSIDLNVNLM